MKYLTMIVAAALLLGACKNNNTDIDATGIFESTEVTISSKVPGTIMELNITEGEQVAPDVKLGVIDTTQLYLKRKQLEASISATDSRYLDTSRQLAAIRQQIANLQREHQRFTELLAANAATQKQVDDIEYQISVLNRQLSASQEQITGSNASIAGQSAGIMAQIAQIDDQISNSLIYSPINGTILNKYAEAGEYASIGRPLFKVADIRIMKLRAYVTAGQLTELKIGQNVKVYADHGDSDRTEYDGKIVWISDKAEFTPKTIQTRDERSNLVYAIKIEVINDGLIKRGMYGDVKF